MSNSGFWRSARHGLGVTVLLLAALGAPSFAQYFGQNKVRYRTFEFKVLKTEHFDIHYYDEEREATQDAARMLERWYARLSRVLNHELPPNQPIILYDSSPSFRSTTVIPGFIGETTGGVTEGLRRRVILPFAGPMAETDHVLGHELVHAFQYDMTRPQPESGLGGVPGVTALPLWFVEGMAEYLSLGPFDPHTAMWLRDAVAHEALPGLKDLNNPRYFPYRFGHAFWAYVAGRWGDQVVGPMLRAAGQSGNVGAAIQSVLKISMEELSQDWRRDLTDQYEAVLARTDAVHSFARELISQQRGGGRINISPAIDPSGRYVAFFSEKSVYSVDLFLADAETGTIIRKITETALNPHFDSFQFVNSAGAWSHDGRQFLYPSIAGGRPQLSIYDMEKEEVVRKIRFRELGEILHPTWSPDGKRVAFSALRGGLMDLYVVDLESERLERITNDSFAEMQPAWSPDGRRIAFVTDRFQGEPASLAYGRYELAMFDVAGGEIRRVAAFSAGKHINPQWTSDSAGLYFVSDQDGVANVYLLSMNSGEIRRVTNVRTGVTGIASLSPALAVAARAGRAVFSVFEAGRYNLYVSSREKAVTERFKSPGIERALAGGLPPLRRGEGQVPRLLESPRVGLARADGFETTKYNPSLALDYIAQPSIGIGVTNFGSLVGGGTALYWSDLLGQHNLMTAFQTSTTMDGNFLNNLSTVVAYQNQKSRWTWGVLGGQVPYVSGGIRAGVTTIEGEPVVFEESTTLWQIERQAAGIFSYPFNRAQRVEFSLGYENIGFDAESRVIAVSQQTGRVVVNQREDLPTPDALHMGTASAALVYDTSIFGGTSPLAGRRYRLEFGSRAGSLSYSTALGDYRQYLRLGRPLTLAGRLLHYGRYGGGAEDSRLQSLFLGFTSLVRGYAPGSFSIAECGPQAAETGVCPVFDQLLGSRLFVANAEARIPLVGPLGLARSARLPPIEIAPFYDAGLAWTSEDQADLLDRIRSPVSSYGLSMRINLLGFSILQISYVRPNDRPLEDGLWEFGLVAGF